MPHDDHAYRAAVNAERDQQPVTVEQLLDLYVAYRNADPARRDEWEAYWNAHDRADGAVLDSVQRIRITLDGARRLTPDERRILAARLTRP